MKGRISISVKILLLSFLNVFLLALVFAAFARVQYRLGSELAAALSRTRPNCGCFAAHCLAIAEY